MSNKTKLSTGYYIGVITLILALLITDSILVARREGYHMDEILSYELSNAEFTPWITPIQPEGRLEKYYREMIKGNGIRETFSNLFAQAGDVLSRRGDSTAANYKADVYDEPVWFSADDFTDYMTYDSEDSVPVLSPYYNSTTDNHPPLYFILVNIFSIFAGERFSQWPGSVLNMLFLVGSVLMLLRLFAKVYGKPYLGLAAAAMYGFSAAGINSVMLIRMYMMVVFWCITVMCTTLEKLHAAEAGAEESPFAKQNKLLIWGTALGFLSQYFFCFFALMLAGCTIVRLARIGRKKDILCYLRSNAFAALAGLLLYPFAFHDLLHTDRGVEALESMTSGLAGLAGHMGDFALLTIRETLGGWIGFGIFALLIAVLIAIRFPEGAVKNIVTPAACFLGYFLIVSRVAPYQVDRYMMPAFPMIPVIFVLLVDALLERTGELIRKPGGESLKIPLRLEGAVLALGLLLVLPNLCLHFDTQEYSFRGYNAQLQVAEQNAGLDCICIHPGYGFYRNVPEMMRYRNSLITKEEELLERVYDQRIVDDTQMILICGNGVDREKMLEYMGSWYGYTESKVLLQEGIYGDTIIRIAKPEAK
ncbi:MAG: hypothetical protein K5891_12435 [Lachnospiraceae bacterium]|nr:hypothetical protein [Lachnospiraceae bacterium]